MKGDECFQHEVSAVGVEGIPDSRSRDRVETLRGKDITPAQLAAPPADLMAQFSFRAWQPDDAPAYREMLDDPELWRFMHEEYPGAITLDLARDFIEMAREASHHKVRAVEYQGRIIGQARAQWSIERTPPHSAEISYWLARPYWGQGLAAPMIALFTWRCLSIFPALMRLTARVHRGNTPSLRALARLGWRDLGAVERSDWQLFALQRADGLDWARLQPPLA